MEFPRFGRKPHPSPLGEVPEGVGREIPGAIQVDPIAHPGGFEPVFREFLRRKYGIVMGAERLKKDLVVRFESHGRGFWIGSGLVVSLLAVGVGAVVVKRRRDQKGRWVSGKEVDFVRIEPVEKQDPQTDKV